MTGCPRNRVQAKQIGSGLSLTRSRRGFWLEPHLISTERSPKAFTVRASPAGRLPGVHPPCRPASPMPSHSLGIRLPAHPGNPLSS